MKSTTTLFIAVAALALCTGAHAACPVEGTPVRCELDLSFGGLACTEGEPPMHRLHPKRSGPAAYRVDMSEYRTVVVHTTVERPEDYALMLGNSPTNNGWGGDGGDFEHDAEIQLFNRSVRLFESDLGGGGAAAQRPMMSPGSTTEMTWTVCDGRAEIASSERSFSYESPTFMQFDGDERDGGTASNGRNDRQLWLGVERSVRDAHRVGTGVQRLTVYFYR